MEAHLRQTALERAREGDPRALGDLLDSFRPYVATTVAGYLRRSAADLVEQGLQGARQDFASFTGTTIAEFVSWLRHRVSSLAERQARTSGQPEAQVPDSATPMDDPNKLAAARTQSLTEALACLSLECQQVILGRHVDGLSQAALGRRLNRSEEAIRILYAQGLCRLRTHYLKPEASPDAGEESEQHHVRLAALLDEALFELRSGTDIDADALATRYPDLGEGIPGLLQTLGDLDATLREWRTVSPATICGSCATEPKNAGDVAADDAEEPLPEQIGRYRILGFAGAGGMGKVYRAHDPHLDRIVALKVPKLDVSAKDRAGWVRRFLREAQSAARIRHPHVCPIYDVGEHDRVPFVVMAFIEGPSLAQSLQGGHLYDDPSAAVRLVRQVGEALEEIHRHGLVHRDLKPANILIDQDGKAILTDFGLARPEQDSEHLTDANALIGTPAFMAPEQTTGEPDQIGPAADLYSLGVVLYLLLTGRLPFMGPPAAILWKIGHEKPPSPTELRPGLDPALEAIVQKTMALRSEDRYASARQLIEALDGWLGGGVGPAPAPIRRESVPSAATQDYPHKVEGQRSDDSSLLNLGVSPSPSGIRRRRRYGMVAVALILILLGGGFLAGPLFRTGGNDTPNGDKPPPDKGRLPLEPLSAKALVVSPLKLDGLLNWTIETRTHRGPVFALAVSPESRRLAAAGDDGMIRLWDSDGGQLLRILVAHDGPVRGLAWSPRGKLLASAGDDGAIRIWDAESGLLLRTVRVARGNTRAVVWSPDGELLASGGEDGKVRLWKASDGSPAAVSFQNEASVAALAWSPDGKALACAGGERVVRVWEVASGQLLQTLQGHELPQVSALAWSPVGKALASGGQDGKIIVWNVETGKATRAVDPGFPVTALAWLADGKTLFSGSSAGVQKWDASGKLMETLGRHTGPIHAICCSAEGKLVASSGQDCLVRLWRQGKLATISGHPAGGAAVAWSPDGKLLALAGFNDRTLRLWDAETGQFRSLSPILGKLDRVAAWSPDGETLALGDAEGNVRLWSRTTGKMLTPLRASAIQVLCLAWSPDGNTLASGGADGSVFLWDVKTNKGQQLLKDQFGIFAFSWSPDGGSLACGMTQEVQIWRRDGKRPEQVLPGGAGPTRVVCWSPNGKLLVTADGWLEGKVQLWKTHPWELKQSAAGHNMGVQAGAWSGDGSVFASGGADAAVRCWESDPWQSSLTSFGHGAAVCSLSWRAKSRILATASEDGSVRIGERKPLAVLVPLRDGRGLVVDAEGRHSCSAETDCLVFVVKTERGQETLSAADFARQFPRQGPPAKLRLPEN